MSNLAISTQIEKCRNLLERGEQAVRHEAWDSLQNIQQSYLETFDMLRTLLGDHLADQHIREQLEELERRQRCLIYEFRKGQALIKARLEDLHVARTRLDRFGTDIPPFYSASLDRSF